MNKRVPRKTSTKIGKKKFRNSDEAYLESQYMSSCCSEDTIRKLFTYGAFEGKRNLYNHLPNETAKSKFIDQLLQSSIRIGEDNIAFFEFHVDGKKLPKNCLCHLFGFSKTKLNTRICCIVYENGQYIFDDETIKVLQSQQHGNKGRKNEKSSVAVIHNLATNWIANALTGLVDESPSENKRYMPCYLKLTDLLPDLRDHLFSIGIAEVLLPSVNLMKTIIARDHPTLRFPRKNKLGACDTCTNLRTQKLLAKTDAEKKAVQVLMRKHTNQHRGERKLFYQRREDSALHPTLQWSTLSDSTSRMCLPHISPIPKGWATIKRMGTKVFGLINFATKYRVLVPIPPVWKMNCNFTISLTYHHYYRMMALPNTPRAPVLYETSDGSPTEYKNAVNLASACFKVLIGMFEEVYLYNLPVGHSHDLQDQVWSNLKRGFYSSRTIIWEDFVRVTSRSFASFIPDVITDIYIYDWKKWFSPWMLQITHHSKWRAFKIFKDPNKPGSVMLMWKENELSNEDFHGSEEHPGGIELLLEIPLGKPERIHPGKLDLAEISKVPQTFSNMKPGEITWWEEVLQTGEIPGYCQSDPPDDYFDFEKLKYESWKNRHPFVYQVPVAINPHLQNIQVDDERGFLANGNRFFELAVGDIVSVRNDEGTFWLGKIRKVYVGDNVADVNYNVWYYQPTGENADIWNFRTRWEPCSLLQNDSNADLSLNHLLTVRMKLARGGRLRKESLELIRRALSLDDENPAVVNAEQTQNATVDDQANDSDTNNEEINNSNDDNNNNTNSNHLSSDSSDSPASLHQNRTRKRITSDSDELSAQEQQVIQTRKSYFNVDIFPDNMRTRSSRKR